jgi:hypothetical protein
MTGHIQLAITGRPVPLQRSRTSRGRHYLPPSSRTFRELVQAEWLAAGRPSLGGTPFIAGCHKLPIDAHGPRTELDLWSAAA